jgi:inhibitor of cysteine peptidase
MVKKSAVQELNEASKGQTIVTPMGKTINVRLKSNRTTGYGWKVSACDDKVLKAAGEPAYETPDTQMMGAGGHDVFTFEPVKPGQTVLKLDYVRSWEKNTPPEQTWSVTITVLPKPPANRHGRRS